MTSGCACFFGFLFRCYLTFILWVFELMVLSQLHLNPNPA